MEHLNGASRHVQNFYLKAHLLLGVTHPRRPMCGWFLVEGEGSPHCAWLLWRAVSLEAHTF